MSKLFVINSLGYPILHATWLRLSHSSLSTLNLLAFFFCLLAYKSRTSSLTLPHVSPGPIKYFKSKSGRIDVTTYSIKSVCSSSNMTSWYMGKTCGSHEATKLARKRLGMVRSGPTFGMWMAPSCLYFLGSRLPSSAGKASLPDGR